MDPINDRMKSMAPEEKQARVCEMCKQDSDRVSRAMVYFGPHLEPHWCDRVAATA